MVVFFYFPSVSKGWLYSAVLLYSKELRPVRTLTSTRNEYPTILSMTKDKPWIHSRSYWEYGCIPEVESMNSETSQSFSNIGICEQFWEYLFFIGYDGMTVRNKYYKHNKITSVIVHTGWHQYTLTSQLGCWWPTICVPL